MDLSHLLHRGESEALDFKSRQYPFAGADDQAKSELLKDILAMANSWRTEPAFILVGVDESTVPPTVCGITDQLDDAHLQQFVHGKTQRPVKFSYRAAELHGVAIGVIEIPVQSRPIHLKKDFGKLTANVVYVRRGSSTNPASPDEIAEMGRTPALSDVDFKVEFADLKERRERGQRLEIKNCHADLFDDLRIKDFKRDTRGTLPYLVERPNEDYFRQLVEAAKCCWMLKPALITVANLGSQPASEIRVEFSVKDSNRRWEFRTIDDHNTRKPRRFPLSPLDGLNPAVVRLPGRPFCEIEYLVDTWHLAFNFGHLQPGRRLWPALKFFVGARDDAKLILVGRILVNELRAAATCQLVIAAHVTRYNWTVDQLDSIFSEHEEEEDVEGPDDWDDAPHIS